ncbi:MarR family transcriptional regulator [Rubrobacter tropicus]|uniref:Manganese transport regulator n=1 Tax=Rubrobacter tropicus TaxID=2653851 RepID=A0A6G8QDE2_9ACTN|nr:MarR family transcriptional regulator [Rubrobacter tropicus]
MDGKMDGATIPRSPSSSVGDYLKAIWESAEAGPASTKEVAERLSVSKASVTNMFARLREMGLVEYERYRGASLTEEGRVEAHGLIRRHRLIETFLLEHLGLPVGGGARGGREAGACRLRLLHRAAGRTPRAPRARPPRRPHPRRGRDDRTAFL